MINSCHFRNNDPGAGERAERAGEPSLYACLTCSPWTLSHWYRSPKHRKNISRTIRFTSKAHNLTKLDTQEVDSVAYWFEPFFLLSEMRKLPSNTIRLKRMTQGSGMWLKNTSSIPFLSWFGIINIMLLVSLRLQTGWDRPGTSQSMCPQSDTQDMQLFL